MKKRQQLTLFCPLEESILIEKIRRQYNPVQYDLIACHVTLCREDEILEIEKVLANLRSQRLKETIINFEIPIRFSNNNGLMLPGKGRNEGFHALRKQVLQEITSEPRSHQPHITLMHPRNSTCTDEIFETIKKYRHPSKITFVAISLIEQEIGKKWKTIANFPLK